MDAAAAQLICINDHFLNKTTNASTCLTEVPMSRRAKTVAAPTPRLAKCPSGVAGLDTITGGGLPRGRPTLVCGGSDSGKALFGKEFLVRGIQEYGEPGVSMCFEEREDDLTQNVASLGFDLPVLIAGKKPVIDQVTIEPAEVIETREYNLDARVTDQIATRRLQVSKYRGAAHGPNEHPFLIDGPGLTVLPITGIGLQYAVSREVVSTGVPKIDAMLGGNGYFRGGSLLVSGTTGAGKTNIAAHFINGACRRGER
jgi:archaellum biogenesis ATPase FlaH